MGSFSGFSTTQQWNSASREPAFFKTDADEISFYERNDGLLSQAEHQELLRDCIDYQKLQQLKLQKLRALHSVRGAPKKKVATRRVAAYKLSAVKKTLQY